MGINEECFVCHEPRRSENGVREVIQNLLADIDLTMGLTGRKSIAKINVDIQS